MNCKFKEYPACNDFFKNCPSAEYVEVGKDKVCKFMQARFVCEIADEKRKPVDGKLRMTKEELVEFEELFIKKGVRLESVRLGGQDRIVVLFMEKYDGIYLDNYKAIGYLLKRFELIKED